MALHTLLTSMCSPSRRPLREKLEQLSISSAPAQRATAVACRVSPERADHTERQYSCSSAMGQMASAARWAPRTHALGHALPTHRAFTPLPATGRALPSTQQAAEVFTCTQPGGQPSHTVGCLELLLLGEPRRVHDVLGGEVQEALPELGEAQLGLGAEQHGSDACGEPRGAAVRPGGSTATYA